MRKKLILTALASSLILAGCGQDAQNAKQAPLPLVAVQDVSVVSHQQSKSYIGRIEAVEDTAITAQVSGYLQSRHFKEGQMVEKGQLLYSIEPSSFEAEVATSKAAITKAQASIANAKAKAERYKELLSIKAVSQQDYDEADAAYKGAKADLLTAQAQLKTAEINLN